MATEPPMDLPISKLIQPYHLAWRGSKWVKQSLCHSTGVDLVAQRVGSKFAMPMAYRFTSRLGDFSFGKVASFKSLDQFFFSF